MSSKVNYLARTITPGTKCVLDIIKNYYSLTPVAISKCAGYDNHNFVLEARSSGTECRDLSKYFVKASVGWSNAGVVRQQHNALDHIGAKGITASQPVKTHQGDSVVKLAIGGQDYVMQTLTYVDGIPLNQAVENRGDLDGLCTQVGEYLAWLHVALRNCEWDPSASLSDPNGFDGVWKSGQGMVVEGHLDAVTDARMEMLLGKYIRECRRLLNPRLGELREGVVHSDYSDTNVLVNPSNDVESPWEISGVIDFEDACYGYLSGDLGICLAYVMMKSASLPDSDPIETAGKIVKGYLSVNPLTKAERETLFEFAIERLTVSYVMARIKLQSTPENEETILLQSRFIPDVLERIESLGRNAVLERWFT